MAFTNDRFPRSKEYPEKYLITVVKKGGSIGANATILPGVVIGRNAMIGAGAVVTRDVPPNAIVIGNPGYIRGYVSSLASWGASRINIPEQSTAKMIECEVEGVKIYNLPSFTDLRGSLSAAEYGRYLPFIPKRYFLVFGVASREIRGNIHTKRWINF